MLYFSSLVSESKQQSEKTRTTFPYLSSTAVTKALHNWVNFLLKHLCQFWTVLIYPGSFAVIEPGVIEHEPDVIYILPWFLILPCIQLPLYSREVHGVLHYVKVILKEVAAYQNTTPELRCEMTAEAFSAYKFFWNTARKTGSSLTCLSSCLWHTAKSKQHHIIP